VKIAEILTFPGENSCWPGTGESLLVLELHEPEDTTAGDNFPLQTEVATDRWGEHDDDDDSIEGKAVCVPTCHTQVPVLIEIVSIITYENDYTHL
jgi:hypothetical protein